VQAFTRLTGVGVPLDLPNIDTDRVIPARFLRKPQGSAGYDRYLFHDVRFDAAGAESPDFVLNQAPYRPATILVAAENFGCGSSREAAVWALMAYGIRVVVAPSLGDIFHQNCLKNGVLPVVLATDVVAGLRRQLRERPGATLTADLETQTLTAPDGATHRFTIEPFARQMLLTGQDEIALTLGYEAQIRAYEARQRAEQAWLSVGAGGRGSAGPRE
jgi:3-isopropylmalate/(R)-2-methylmalate dehydratase small subunit